VTDPAGASVPGAGIQLKAQATGEIRTATSNQEGIFRITDLAPGAYNLTVTAAGFKTYAQSALNLAAQETRDLGKLQLVVGSQVEQVSVTAVATPVQTASSEKSSEVTGNQLNQIAIRGRDILAMANLIPGAVDTAPGETATRSAITNLNIGWFEGRRRRRAEQCHCGRNRGQELSEGARSARRCWGTSERTTAERSLVADLADASGAQRAGSCPRRTTRRFRLGRTPWPGRGRRGR
jgi:hypothetical protein